MIIRPRETTSAMMPQYDTERAQLIPGSGQGGKSSSNPVVGYLDMASSPVMYAQVRAEDTRKNGFFWNFSLHSNLNPTRDFWWRTLSSLCPGTQEEDDRVDTDFLAPLMVFPIESFALANHPAGACFTSCIGRNY